jgi:mannose-1-phosphate guanylyltransferase
VSQLKEVEMRTILLAGCPVHHEPGCSPALPRPLWPMVMSPLVSRLIERLVDGGTRALSVCANGRTGLYSARLSRDALKLEQLCFVQDPLPRGPAGCIKDNEAFIADETFVVANAACWIDEPVASLVARHKQQRNKLTVFCAANSRAPSGIYVCEPEVLKHIPAVGYCDIKEQLIPRLLDRGLRVGALPLHGWAAEVVNTSTYLALHRELLRSSLSAEVGYCPGEYRPYAPDVWVSASAQIGRNVRLFGPLIVGPRTKMKDGAVVIGPGSVGPGAVIAGDAIVTECAVWANACVSRGRCIDRQLVIPELGKSPREASGFMSRVRQRVLSHWSSSYVGNQ